MKFLSQEELCKLEESIGTEAPPTEADLDSKDHIKRLEKILIKYKQNPLKYFLQLSNKLFNLVIYNVMGLAKYKDEFSKCLENCEDDPLLHIRELAISICEKLQIKTEYEETISSIVQKIINHFQS